MRAGVVQLLIVGLAAGLLAGCGGDDEPEDPGPPRTDFLARANAICENEGQEIDLYLEPINKRKPHPLDYFPALEQLVPALELQLNRLRELEKPKDAEDEINRVFAAMQKAIDDGKRAIDEARLDERAAQRFLENPVALEQAAAAARDFGLHECTKVPGED